MAKKKRRKSVLSTPPSLKRRRGTEILLKGQITLKKLWEGRWSQLENCVLEVTKITSSSNLEHAKNIYIHTVYNFVIESDFAKCNSFRLNGRKTKASFK